MHRVLRWLLAVLPVASALGAACQLSPPSDAAPGPLEGAGPVRPPSLPAVVADAGVPRAATPPRTVVTWNLEWFLDPTRGPEDDARQLDGARAVLAALAPDVVALQELSSPAALDALLAGLPLQVAAITAFEWPQQLALAHGPRLGLRAARVLDALASAGRAPLEVELQDLDSGARVVVIAVHAKAYADAASWAERAAQAAALHAYLLSTWPDAELIVLGDLNDGLTRSITTGEASPYASFVADPRFATPTAALERTSGARTLIDHVIASDELSAQLRPDAAARIDVAALAGGLSASAISDHVPIEVSFAAFPR